MGRTGVGGTVVLVLGWPPMGRGCRGYKSVVGPDEGCVEWVGKLWVGSML